MHRVHADAVLGVLHRRRLGDRPHRALGCVVAHMHSLLPDYAADGRYVDDRAAARFFHRGDGVEHAEEYAFGVDVHKGVPPLGVQAFGAVRAADARVVDQHIQPAVSLHGGVHRALPVRLAGDIQADERRLAARLGYLRLHLARLIFQDVGDNHLSALAREYPALLRAHAARAARNNRNLACQPHSVPPDVRVSALIGCLRHYT